MRDVLGVVAGDGGGRWLCVKLNVSMESTWSPLPTQTMHGFPHALPPTSVHAHNIPFAQQLAGHQTHHKPDDHALDPPQEQMYIGSHIGGN